jgi:hypothetical protein
MNSHLLLFPFLITNPTRYDAQASVLAEDAKQAKKPQGYTAFLFWPRIAVNAGESKTIAITNNGTIQ